MIILAWFFFIQKTTVDISDDYPQNASMKHIDFFRVFFALFFLLGFMYSVQASMIYYEKLDRIVAKSNFIIQGKIAATNEKADQNSIEYSFSIKLTQSIFGNVKTDMIQAKYIFSRPGLYTFVDDLGKIQEQWESPLESGSGLEEQAQNGQEYIFFFEKKIPDADGYQLLRIEPIDKRAEIVKLLELPQKVAFDATVNSITNICAIKTQKKALMVGIDPRWILNVQVLSVADDQDMLSENTEIDFAIHSPAKMFFEDRKKISGKTYAFELTKTRKIPASTSYSLKAFPWLIENEDFRIYDIRIVDWGIYKAKIGEKKNIATIVDGVVFVTYDKELVQLTDQITAKKDLSFGFRYLLRGFPDTAKPLVKIIVQHPPIKNPQTGRMQTESFWDDNAYIGGLNYNTGWIFAYDYEIVSGKWVIKLYYKNKKLLEKKFLVK